MSFTDEEIATTIIAWLRTKLHNPELDVSALACARGWDLAQHLEHNDRERGIAQLLDATVTFTAGLLTRIGMDHHIDPDEWLQRIGDFMTFNAIVAAQPIEPTPSEETI